MVTSQRDVHGKRIMPAASAALYAGRFVYASVNECNECAMAMSPGGAGGSGRYFGRAVE